MLRKCVSNLLPVNFFPTFRTLMNYYPRKRFEKKNFSSTKKLNFNEPLSHKIFEKNIFISSEKKKIFLFHQTMSNSMEVWKILR